MWKYLTRIYYRVCLLKAGHFWRSFVSQFRFFLKSIRIMRYYNGAIVTVQGETISICYGNKIRFLMFDEMDRLVDCIAVRRGKCNIYWIIKCRYRLFNSLGQHSVAIRWFKETYNIGVMSSQGFGIVQKLIVLKRKVCVRSSDRN